MALTTLMSLALAALATACASDTGAGDGASASATPGAAADANAGAGAGAGANANPPASAGTGTGTSTSGGAGGSQSANGAPALPDGTAPARCAATQITGESVGPLRIGATVEEIAARCPIVRDTTRLGAEGVPARMVAVLIGPDTVEAEIVDGRVWRIPVTTPRLRTSDGLGVGVRLARLLEIPDARPAMGEGLYVIAPSHCGLSFQLANPGGALPAATTVAQLRRLPATTVVSRVLVTGCSRS